MSKEPKGFTEEDYNNYAKLMVKSNALRVDYNPENRKPKSSKSYKWNNILSDIWHNKKKYDGKGVVVIPNDPNALLERLD